jgi:microcompartment protein CcmK/EutM
MELATVVGSCTATVKDEALAGRKLALVRRVGAAGEPVGELEVALDVTGAGAGSTVLLVRGSAARQPRATRQLPTDLAVVAIVDSVDLAPAPTVRTPATGTPARSRVSTARTAPTRR